MKPTTKPEPQSKSTTKLLSRIYSAVFCLVAISITALQTGCSSTGSATQQVFRPQTQAPAWGNQQFQGQAPFNQPSPFGGGSGTTFQGNQGSGTSFQTNPNGQFGFNGGGSGTSFQANSGSGTQSQFGGFPNFQQSQFFQSGFNQQPGFNPFGFGKTSC